jgi:hypothetical protein
MDCNRFSKQTRFRDLAACIFRARLDFQRLALERAWERRALDAPAARSAEKKANQNSHHRYTRTPGAPHAMVYSLYRALPGDRALLTPSLATYANLTPTIEVSGPHVFAVRIQYPRQEYHPRPSHPAPRRDDRERPFQWDRTEIDIVLICDSENQNIFSGRA